MYIYGVTTWLYSEYIYIFIYIYVLYIYIYTPYDWMRVLYLLLSLDEEGIGIQTPFRGPENPLHMFQCAQPSLGMSRDNWVYP